MKESWKQVYYIARKDLKAYYLKPPLISWGLLLPLVFILAFYLRNPEGVREMSPGLVGLSLLFSTTSMAAIVITFEKRIDALERLLLAPLSLDSLILGKALGSAAFGVGMGGITLVLMVAIFRLSLTHWTILIIGLLLSACTFSLMGLMISVSVKEVFEAMTLSNFFRFPMVFLCGVFFAVPNMPLILQGIAYLLPLTHAVDLFRNCIRGEDALFPLLSGPISVSPKSAPSLAAWMKHGSTPTEYGHCGPE